MARLSRRAGGVPQALGVVLSWSWGDPGWSAPGEGLQAGDRGGEPRSPGLTFIKSVRTSFWLLDEGEGVAQVRRQGVFGGKGVLAGREARCRARQE